MANKMLDGTGKKGENVKGVKPGATHPNPGGKTATVVGPNSPNKGGKKQGK